MQSKFYREKDMPASSGEISAQVDAGLAKLSEADRGVLVLRYLQGQSVTEAAAALEISETAVAKRITRALDRLRRVLAANGAITPGLSVGVMLEQLPRTAAPATLAKTAATAATLGGNTAGVAIANGVIHHMIWGKVAAVLAILIGIGGIAAAGGVGMKLLADGSDVAAPVTPVATDTSSVANATTGRLADGVSVSILGIHVRIYSPTGWWAANGDPLALAPCTGMQERPFDSRGHLLRTMVLEIDGRVQGSTDPATVVWSMQNSWGWNQWRIEGANSPDAEGAVVSVDDKPPGVILHARVAAGRWMTIGTWRADGSRDTPQGKISVVMGEPYAVAGNAHVEVAYVDPTSRDDFRLVAFDSQGREIVLPGNSFVGWTGADSGGYVADYSGPIAPPGIGRLEFQMRPFNEFIEIQNISMHLSQGTHPVIKTSDGAAAAQERPVPVAQAATDATPPAKVASGPWKTLVMIVGNGRDSEWTGKLDVCWGASYAVAGETRKIVMWNGVANSEFQLVAVGAGGQREVAVLRQATDLFSTRLAQYSVQMRLRSIARWQVQSRPY